MNDFDKGMITGLAMQPLYVAEPVVDEQTENFCDTYATAGGIATDIGYCKNIKFEED